MSLEHSLNIFSSHFSLDSGIPWRTNTTDDARAVERHAAFQIGAFADPIYTTGDWPTILTDTLPPEYLPRFTEEEKRDILGMNYFLSICVWYNALCLKPGSADFFAIDAYASQYVSAPDEGLDACLSNGPSDPEWPQCNTVREFDSNAMWAVGASADVEAPWLQDTSRFFRDAMKEIHKRWPTDKIVGFLFSFGLRGITDDRKLVCRWIWICATFRERANRTVSY